MKLKTFSSYVIISRKNVYYLTVMSHMHANNDPSFKYNTIHRDLLSKKALSILEKKKYDIY